MAAADPTTDDGVQEALNVKIITMICLFSLLMITGSLPRILSIKYDWFANKSEHEIRSSNRMVNGMLAFGGGVLFATTFMHLLPELDENIQLLQEAGEIPDVPIYLAAFIMCCGFFMMYLIEELVHAYINRREHLNSDPSVTRALSVRRRQSSIGCSPGSGSDTPTVLVKELKEEIPHKHGQLQQTDDSVVATLRGLLVVLALSVHELFEGLAVGLESSKTKVWYMFGAVSAHKYIIAFCVGMELLAAGTTARLSLVYVFTFSFVSALGIGVGVVMVGGAGAAAAGLYSVILQGIACGTLVYVVFYEIWRQDRNGLFQLFCSVVGFMLMIGLEVFTQCSTY